MHASSLLPLLGEALNSPSPSLSPSLSPWAYLLTDYTKKALS